MFLALPSAHIYDQSLCLKLSAHGAVDTASVSWRVSQIQFPHILSIAWKSILQSNWKGEITQVRDYQKNFIKALLRVTMNVIIIFDEINFIWPAVKNQANKWFLQVSCNLSNCRKEAWKILDFDRI